MWRLEYFFLIFMKINIYSDIILNKKFAPLKFTYLFLQELESLNFFETGPNFHKLQVYSNTFEDLIEETTTFSYLLRCVKVELSILQLSPIWFENIKIWVIFLLSVE